MGLGEAFDLPFVATTYVLAVTLENLYRENKFFLPLLFNYKPNFYLNFIIKVRKKYPF